MSLKSQILSTAPGILPASCTLATNCYIKCSHPPNTGTGDPPDSSAEFSGALLTRSNSSSSKCVGQELETLRRDVDRRPTQDGVFVLVQTPTKKSTFICHRAACSPYIWNMGSGAQEPRHPCLWNSPNDVRLGLAAGRRGGGSAAKEHRGHQCGE